jgi:predicted membrane protein
MKMEAQNSLEVSRSDYLCTQRPTRKQRHLHLLECSLCIAVFFFFFFFFSSSSWRWNSNWVVACSAVLFHASLSLAVLLQFRFFIFPVTLWHHPPIWTSAYQSKKKSAQCQIAYRKSHLEWPDVESEHKNCPLSNLLFTRNHAFRHYAGYSEVLTESYSKVQMNYINIFWF